MLKHRLERGLTLRALAEQCVNAGAPVSSSQLSKIERGLSAPSPAVRAALARVLDLDVLEDFKLPATSAASREPTTTGRSNAA